MINRHIDMEEIERTMEQWRNNQIKFGCGDCGHWHYRNEEHDCQKTDILHGLWNEECMTCGTKCHDEGGELWQQHKKEVEDKHGKGEDNNG